jgi:hypothetical protein
VRQRDPRRLFLFVVLQSVEIDLSYVLISEVKHKNFLEIDNVAILACSGSRVCCDALTKPVSLEPHREGVAPDSLLVSPSFGQGDCNNLSSL